MKIEDIIESLNRHIEDKRKKLNLDTKLGHLVLQRTIKPHETFKAYKEYNLTVWFIKGRYKCKVIVVNKVDKVTTDSQEELIMRQINMELCKMIFNLIESDFYEHIIKGEYYG